MPQKGPRILYFMIYDADAHSCSLSSHGADVIRVLDSIAERSIEKTGFFTSGPEIHSNFLYWVMSSCCILFPTGTNY